MRMGCVLTVSESKRLIAKGVAAMPAVKTALEDGVVVISKGTTNAYIVEEILGQPIEKTNYCTGTTWPEKADHKGKVSGAIPDVVLKQGEPVEGASAIGYAGELREGDVFIKGANALNYELGQVGILIGHPTGGTIGAAIGCITARRARLITPVGLEKNIGIDLDSAAAVLNEPGERRGSEPTLWRVDGEIVTEIEALGLLTGVDAVPVGAGGIGGAEGSIRLSIMGTPEQIEATASLLDSIYGEPAFVE